MDIYLNWDNFNTSHVTVYPAAISSCSAQVPYFNTSHVTVYLPETTLSSLLQSFQYIPCYGLSYYGFFSWHISPHFNTSHVTVYRIWRTCSMTSISISIHPMLRFIMINSLPICVIFLISIHPMLRFIYYIVFYRYDFIIISIHPMLRFITTLFCTGLVDVGFQYIPCYGLSYQM